MIVKPENDDHVAIIERQSVALEHYYKYVNRFDVAVQAGGHIGIWPKKMAQKFGRVYTFEPDQLNFGFLVQNCKEANVYKFQAALGFDRGPVAMQRIARNSGASYISGHGCSPVLRVDDLGLDALDFLMLDIEGYEIDAIKGAGESIWKYRPVIVTEVKDLFVRYGKTRADLDALMDRIGYVEVDQAYRDIVWAPSG